MSTKSNTKPILTGSVPAVNVGKAVDMLAMMYVSMIKKNRKMTLLPSVMMWGPPGVGKSQAVRQIAERIELNTSVKVNITDVRLLMFNPIDLRGIPTANEDKTLAVWLKPQIFDMDPGKGIINILFLDEISAAPQSVQAAAYQITLDRTVGEHKLPDNCIVIAAGNRVTDKSVAYKMPKALANRLLHLEIETSYDAWRNWAVRSGINEKVTAFLAFKPDYLMKFDSLKDDIAFPTPRAWEMVSALLNNISDSIEEMYTLIAGIIGTGSAVEFRTWSRVFEQLPDIEMIFDGKRPRAPKRPDALYALISSMARYAYEHRTELDRIANSIAYADTLPPDFSTVLMQDYMNISDDFRSELMKIPEFVKWLRTKGRLLNGFD